MLTLVTRSMCFALVLLLWTASAGISADQATTGQEVLQKYLSNLEHQVQQQWFPPKIHKLKTAIVRFQVHCDGKISDVVLEKATKNKLTDRAALAAVKNACPARKFPTGFPKKLSLRFTFDHYDEKHLSDPNVRQVKHLELIKIKNNGV